MIVARLLAKMEQAHAFTSVRYQNAQNLVFNPTTGAHPFDWSGWQVTSTFSVNF